MARKRNRLGRVNEPGKVLSEPLREEIIEIYNERLSLTDISNDVKVPVRGVNKIINRHGGSRADVLTDDVLHPCIRRLSPQYDRQSKFWCPNETIR